MLRNRMRSVARLSLLVFVLSHSAKAQTVNAEQLLRTAVDAQQKGDLATAIRDYRAYLSTNPDSAEVLANLGTAFAGLGEFDQAIAAYKLALTKDHSNSGILLNLTLAYYKKQDFSDAAGHLETLYRSNPRNLRVAILLGNCYLQLNRPNRAVIVLSALSRVHPDELDLNYVLGSALIKEGKKRVGVTLLERVAAKGNSADAYLLAGATLLDLNDFESAHRDLEAALRLNPNLPDVHTLCGIARDKTGHSDEAEPEFRKALAINPQDFQANLYLGAILYSRRNIAQSKQYLEEAARLQPGSPLAIYELALVKKTSGQLTDAVSDMERVERQDPNWLQPHVELAALYYKLKRQADGMKERQIVDRLTEEQQKSGPMHALAP